MKKSIFLTLISIALFIMPAFNALPIKKTVDIQQKTVILPDYDGTFIGGYGIINKENEEWAFEYYGYIAGIYKNTDKYIILYGNIYNLEQEQIGNMTILTAKYILIGKLSNMQGRSAPVVGFFLKNEDNFFAGRLMSFFGPAPHIWGEFTPN